MRIALVAHGHKLVGENGSDLSLPKTASIPVEADFLAA
jgi:hypothetical protein